MNGKLQRECLGGLGPKDHLNRTTEGTSDPTTRGRLQQSML